MVYKKYIKKNGKLYGPYIYESKRVGGKVVSEYHGSNKTFNFRKYGWIFASVAVVMFLAYFFATFDFSGLTGRAVLSSDVNYSEGTPIKGNVILSLKQGELIPESSKLVLENNDQIYEYNINELVGNNLSEGDFYIEGVSLSGSGSGYGIIGQKEVYPNVSFVLAIYPVSNESDNVSEPIEISGNTSVLNPFVYEIIGGEAVQLKSGSVSLEGNVIGDSNVQVKINDTQVIAETSYLEIEKGFGEEFIGEGEEIISIDLSELNLVLNEGELLIKIVNGNDEIISTSVVLSSGEISSVTESVSNSTEMNVTIENPAQIQQTPPIFFGDQTVQIINAGTVQYILTEEEKAALANEYGSDLAVTTKIKIVNDLTVVRYELGKEWIEYSYKANISQDELNIQMSLDRMKWLKDLAQRIVAKKTPVQETQFTENLSLQ